MYSSKPATLRTVIAFGIFYLLLIGTIVLGNALITMSRTQVAELALTGHTVAEARAILGSEGYGNGDYRFVTPNGAVPGEGWRVGEVKDGRQAVLMVPTQERVPMASMGLVGMGWDAAEGLLQREGYFPRDDYNLSSNGSIWFKANWVVTKVGQGPGRVATVTLEEKFPDLAAGDRKTMDRMALDVAGKPLDVAQTALESSGLQRGQWVVKNDGEGLIWNPATWVVKSAGMERNRLVLHAVPADSPR